MGCRYLSFLWQNILMRNSRQSSFITLEWSQMIVIYSWYYAQKSPKTLPPAYPSERSAK